MTTVFISGSRMISRLNDLVCGRLQNMIDQDFRIIVGDANGADKALQGFLAAARYENVIVYCAGSICRNNLGNWRVKKIQVDPKFRGRDFYAQKDKEMALEADYGFVLWDGKSAGSICNVIELLKQQKPAAIFLSSEKRIVSVSHLQDVQIILKSCDRDDYQKLSKKIDLARHLDDLKLSTQGTLF